MKKKSLTLLVAVAMLACAAVGGTLAWLTDTTDEVKNVFATTGINIELKETFNTDTDDDGYGDAWYAEMVPGYTYKKDPVVRVLTGSEDCYLFVKFEENNNVVKDSDGKDMKAITFTSELTEANGWTQGTGTGTGGDGVPTNVWYLTVFDGDGGVAQNGLPLSWERSLIKEDKVTINENLTNEQMQSIVANGTPTLTYTAYACQLWKTNKPGADATEEEIAAAQFTAGEAWAKVGNSTTPAVPEVDE